MSNVDIRVIRYETLLKTGRAVKLKSEKSNVKGGRTVWWVEMHVAGVQSRTPHENLVRVGFDSKRSARQAYVSLWLVLRQMEHEHKLATDTGYNKVARQWAEAAAGKIKEKAYGARPGEGAEAGNSGGNHAQREETGREEAPSDSDDRGE